MTNQELFLQYNTENWVIEQNLCFLLQKYWAEYGKAAIEQAKCGYTTSNMPYNPVSFVKKFMKEETLCDVKYAEKSKISTVKDSVIGDADFIELT